MVTAVSASRLAHAGDGLVEQKEFRLGGERTRNVDPFLNTEGQQPCPPIGVDLKIEGGEQRPRLLARVALGLAGLSKPKRRRQQAVGLMPIESRQDIIEHASIAEQLHMLEGAAKPQR